MPINKSKVKQPHSFNDKHYWNRFTEKQLELFKSLERNPNDLATKKQFQFVDRVLREGEKSDNFNWTNAWQSWEEAHYLTRNFDKWNTPKEKEK